MGALGSVMGEDCDLGWGWESGNVIGRNIYMCFTVLHKAHPYFPHPNPLPRERERDSGGGKVRDVDRAREKDY